MNATTREILIVEDSRTQAQALSMLLEAEGYATFTARTGAAALSALEERRFDLVLSDVVMPHMSGYELCRAIKQHADLRRLPVVLLTSLADPLDIVRGLECGADNYITKPYEPDDLLTRVARVFENQELRRAARPDHGVDITFLGQRFTITSEKEQILDLLISSFEELIRTNQALRASEAERARQLAREREARADAEATARRLRLLQSVSDAALGDGDMDAFLHHVLTAIRSSLAVDGAMIVLADDAGAQLDVRVAQGIEPDVLAAARETLHMQALDTDETQPSSHRLTQITEAADRAGSHLRPDFPAPATVPLIAAGQSLGVLQVARRNDGGFIGDDLRTLTLVADRIAVAIDRARLREREHAARMEAEQANRAKAEFLAAMSHDLRTPLNAIGGYADLLLLGLRGDVTAEQKDFLERIMRSQRHLLALVNDILSFSRTEAGQLPLALEDVPLDLVLRQTNELVEPQMAQKGLQFSYEPTADLQIHADIEKVQQILLNLLSNAVKFTDPGGTVTIRSELANGGRLVAIHVQDTGHGIPSSWLDAIFDPFVQVHEEGATRREGVGLGLAISRNLARAMGGELTAASELGAGSTFTLVVPRSVTDHAES